jgi:hypothetical protein
VVYKKLNSTGNVDSAPLSPRQHKKYLPLRRFNTQPIRRWRAKIEGDRARQFHSLALRILKARQGNCEEIAAA